MSPLTRFLKQTLAACLVGTLMPLAAAVAQTAAQQPAGETVKATHGDWEIVCTTAKPDECAMRQIGKTADGKPILVIVIQKLNGVKTNDGKQVPAAIQITAPLGTLLRAGVAVKIDNQEPRAAPFDVCLRQGCLVRQPMGEDFLAAMKAGQKAVVRLIDFPDREVTAEISLKGFTKAFDAL